MRDISFKPNTVKFFRCVIPWGNLKKAKKSSRVVSLFHENFFSFGLSPGNRIGREVCDLKSLASLNVLRNIRNI